MVFKFLLEALEMWDYPKKVVATPVALDKETLYSVGYLLSYQVS